ncbi:MULTISPECIES: hypothetical protein [unclassified Nodularia (in: cyanobacteria)]|uniref:hypothetical protein n=1 Tax=unclassified Nodularia (in: cyanobacteria) TaxID=2656917 RepID=UPI001882990B|nr:MULTISPECIES: hypothetical protein [unclassified Nodularia (in: cyanobacteria)]MBE9198982.1 hypothetical protein [Nodularia sp. LEGE 06071]MCC2695919.1 hypothetical protein [Nodularia sp. LEGE 04288]
MPQPSTRDVEFPIHISAKKIAQRLIIIISCLTVTGALSGYFLVSDFQFPSSKWFYELFSLDEELNIPAWYSSFTLLFCSGLLAVITSIKKTDKYFIYWKNLSLLFLIFSLDEAFSLHEILIIPALREQFNFSPIFFHTWVIFGIPAVIFFLYKYFKFFLDLPKKTQYLFLLAAIFYVGGALGMEMVSGLLRESFGRLALITTIGIVIEELLEMLGVLTFIYALLTYFSSFQEIIHLKVYISEK